jgi:nicotinamide-nucleotide adenylyltransferase
MRIGILIGRFQPLHKGHVEAIAFSLQYSDKLFIVIGSSEKSNQKRNPFTFEERKNMFKLVINFRSMNDKAIKIVPITDAKNHLEWIKSINNAIGDYNVIFTNDELTEKLFKKQNVEVINVPLLEREELSGTEVRKRLELDKDWQDLVMPIVAEYLVKINASDRIKSII